MKRVLCYAAVFAGLLLAVAWLIAHAAALLIAYPRF